MPYTVTDGDPPPPPAGSGWSTKEIIRRYITVLGSPLWQTQGPNGLPFPDARPALWWVFFAPRAKRRAVTGSPLARSVLGSRSPSSRSPSLLLGPRSIEFLMPTPLSDQQIPPLASLYIEGGEHICSPCATPTLPHQLQQVVQVGPAAAAVSSQHVGHSP